eukprot:TRINITY_DN62984_c0_g1_i2.p1 TRINITY_DN62984_c0_g1~~TRINITY_DN62984_c0_g1_i2.p1  ORF type:complete len:321 (+),score=12.06 TRINITY_DN62984_c0_g1_i2:164-1126(+)
MLWLLLFVAIIPTVIGIIWPLRRLLQRYASLLGCRLLLLLLGFWNIKKTYFPFFEVAANSFAFVGGKQAPAPTKPQPSSPVQLIICNYSSYVDILYLAFRFAPVFAFPVVCPDEEQEDNFPIDHVEYGGLFTALARTTTKLDNQLKAREQAKRSERKSSKVKAAGIPLQELLERATKGHWGPVVLFPEGTTSNGKGILEWTEVLHGLDEKLCATLGVKVVGCSYADGNKTFSPTLPLNDSWQGHVWTMLSQVYNTLEVKEIRAAEIPSMTRAVSLEGWCDVVRVKLGTALKTPVVAVGVDEKAQLLTMWAETQSVSYGKK